METSILATERQKKEISDCKCTKTMNINGNLGRNGILMI
jgi:hypothetical protein